jgi:hypothetical protein
MFGPFCELGFPILGGALLLPALILSRISTEEKRPVAPNFNGLLCIGGLGVVAMLVARLAPLGETETIFFVAIFALLLVFG